jgi:hypothetical protein
MDDEKLQEEISVPKEIMTPTSPKQSKEVMSPKIASLVVPKLQVEAQSPTSISYLHRNSLISSALKPVESQSLTLITNAINVATGAAESIELALDKQKSIYAIPSALEGLSPRNINPSPLKETLKIHKPPSTECPCLKVISKDSECGLCGGTISLLVDLNSELQDTKETLKSIGSELALSLKEIKNLEESCESYRKKRNDLREELKSKKEEFVELQKQLEILGNKLIDEIEKRDEIQYAQEAVGNELETLTQSLFEEANNLVANEARQRQGALDIQKSTEKKLEEVQMFLKIEQEQLKELRSKFAQSQLEDSQIVTSNPQKPEINFPNLSINMMFDNREFSEFLELLNPDSLNPKSLYSKSFMKNSYDDDVLPCFRKWRNKVSKKLVEQIIENQIVIVEMDNERKIELENRDIELKRTKIIDPVPIMPSMFLRLKGSSGPMFRQGHPGCCNCENEEPYRYHFELSVLEKGIWNPICLSCHAQLVAVCDFYNFFRNLLQGLYSDYQPKDLYSEVLHLKRSMFFSRVGLAVLPDPETAFNVMKRIYKCGPSGLA